MCCFQQKIKTGTFTKTERITSKDDIRALFKCGKKASVSGAKLFFFENGQGFSRFAVTFPRGYGNAVMRNKTKRLCRESFRRQKKELARGWDFLFLIFQVQSENFNARYSQMRALCEKAGLLAAGGTAREQYH
jgi:ribonuclease P protein component